MKSSGSSSITVQQEAGNLWVCRFRGTVKRKELDAANASIRQQAGPDAKLRILALLADFTGWERNPAAWAEITEADVSGGDDVERMAIVGDPRWETEALMFVGAGLRRMQVRYFPTSEERAAREWLGTD